MDRKSASEKANGVRLLLNAKNAVLEPSGRASWLSALAVYTDAQTGYSAASVANMSLIARQDARSFRRAQTAWAERDLRHLVLDLDARRGGPYDARLFRVHWERLQWTARALMLTRRRIGAGAARAVERRGLIGAPASGENCLALVSALQGALLAENEYHGARMVEACSAGLIEAMDGWPDRVLDHASDLTALAFANRVEGLSDRAVDNHPDDIGFMNANPDILSANPDILSTAYYKEDSPQGILKRAHEASLWTKSERRSGGESGEADQGGVGAPYVRSINLAYLAARLGGNSKWRAHLGEALLGCRVWAVENCLVIAASDGDQVRRLHEALGSRIYDQLEAMGFDGYQITVRVGAADGAEGVDGASDRGGEHGA